jgi:hypothetical protein
MKDIVSEMQIWRWMEGLNGLLRRFYLLKGTQKFRVRCAPSLSSGANHEDGLSH